MRVSRKTCLIGFILNLLPILHKESKHMSYIRSPNTCHTNQGFLHPANKITRIMKIIS